VTNDILQAIIPAHPNWFVAYLIAAEKPGERDTFDLEPILAWEVWRDDGDCWKGNRWILPITLDGAQQLNNGSWLIKRPDGTFYEDGTRPMSEELALQLLRRRYDLRRQAEAAE
jgi:hypothetical protein